jgi:hypothetical protein
VHAGYEGSAHDAAVYRDALTKGFLRVPTGKYFIGDAGYTERDGFDNTVLAPYQKSDITGRNRDMLQTGRELQKSYSTSATLACVM